MPASNHLLNRAIQLFRAGDTLPAVQLLAGLLLQEPDNASVRAWFCHACPESPAQLAALQDAYTHHANRAELSSNYWRLAAQLTPPAPQPAAPAEPEPSLPSQSSPARSGRLPASILISLGVLLVAVALVLWQTGKLASYLQAIEQITFERDTLQASYNSVAAQLIDRTNQFNQLTNDYQALAGLQADLQTRFDRLQSDFDSLQVDYNSLQRRFSGLADEYVDLEKNSVRPPYIIISGRKVDMAFKKLDDSILHWNIGFDSLEANIERGQDSRAHLFTFLGGIDSRYALEMPAPGGQHYNVVDYRMFVDSAPFQKVMKNVYDDAPDEEAFLRETWNIMAQLTTYAFDPEQETPRYPLETLLAGGGDCEDTSILFASMIKAAPVDWKVSFIYMDGDHPDSMEDLNHLAVAVDTGRRVYFVETTSKREMAPYAAAPDGWYLALP